MHTWLVLHFFKWDAHPCNATSPRIWMLVTKHDQHLGRSIIFTYLHHIFRKTNCFFFATWKTPVCTVWSKPGCRPWAPGSLPLPSAGLPTWPRQNPCEASATDSVLEHGVFGSSVEIWWWHGSTRTISPMLGILIKNDMLMIFDDSQQHGIVLLFAVSISIQ